jgi:aminomethyltransferase
MADSESDTLSVTPLHAAHVALGAKMVPFAGYDMPVQYPMGVLGEHNWTRENAGLFDVSHMGQAALRAKDHATAAAAIEALVPADILKLAAGKQRYSQLTAPDGGILDDLMITRPGGPDHDGILLLVVNAACKAADFDHIAKHLPEGVTLETFPDQALLALQGPKAAAVLAARFPEVAAMGFMSGRTLWWGETALWVSRSGYTGEDGYEISVPAARATELWNLLLSDDRVKPIGLGARDSLRLEAGLCLYGHDMDATTSPVEGNLVWSIQKRRQEAGGFPGARRILAEIAGGIPRLRVGVLPDGKAPAREGAEIVDPETGAVIGKVTSGGFSPTLSRPIAMGYVPDTHSALGTLVHLIVRGKPLPARVAALPFVPTRYYRAPE